MPEGPLGLDRPFVEDDVAPLYVSFKYASKITGPRLTNISKAIQGDIEDTGTVVSDVSTFETLDNSVAAILLGTTSIDDVAFNRMLEIGDKYEGFKGLFLSSEPPQDTMRL